LKFEIPEAAVVAADGLTRLAPMKKEAFALVLMPVFPAEFPLTMAAYKLLGPRIIPRLGAFWLFCIWITFLSF
jgi:hypothetical protein